MEFNFNSRDTYLAQVALWKTTYAEHSQRIRDTRRTFREAQSAYSKGQGSDSAVGQLRWELDALRDQARGLLYERQEAKEEAARQWQARRDHEARQAQVA
jgi:hypothetical protein